MCGSLGECKHLQKKLLTGRWFVVLHQAVAEPGHFQWGGQDGTSDHFRVALKSLLYEHKISLENKGLFKAPTTHLYIIWD